MSRYKLSSDTRTPRLFTLYPRKLRNTWQRLEQQMTWPMIMGRQPLGRPNSWSSSTRKTSIRWWGISGRKKPCMESSPTYLYKDHVDVELSFKWMKHTGLKGETEGLITAAQDQALNTRYYSKHIIKQGTTDTCSMCHTQPETVEHIISGCQTLAAD